MAYKTVALTTTGTSLLSNANRVCCEGKYRNLLEIPDDKVREFIHNNVKAGTVERLSAEINAVIQTDRYLKKRDNEGISTVHLLLSETEEMEKEKIFLITFFQQQGFEVQADTIAGLKYKESQFKVTGLRSLINRLIELIEEYRDKQFRVVMNSTGGFKAEIAFATVIAQMRQVESYYLYESFNEIIPLPFLPLNLDVTYWSRYLNYFRDFTNGVTEKETDLALRRLPEGFRFLIEYHASAGKWVLNLAGLVFFESLESEARVHLKSIDPRNVFVMRGESTLWSKACNTHVAGLEDIPDNKVRILLRRVLRLSFVRKIELVDYHEVKVSHGETRLEYKTHHADSKSHYAQYEIKCKHGIQVINIYLDPGFTEDLLLMIGKKASL